MPISKLPRKRCKVVDKSYTEAYQTHEDCGYGYKVVCCCEDKYSKPIQTYQGGRCRLQIHGKDY